tara:strand:+ start:221 stop:523 length:303 start_codon:yes stop_codon:yes gene_type:complete
MSDKKYDSVLVGYAEEPHLFEGQLSSWSVRLKDTELKEMIEKYATRRNEAGEGGNVYLKIFMAQSGKSCCSVFDPNSEGAKEKRAAKAAKAEAVTDDMPF